MATKKPTQKPNVKSSKKPVRKTATKRRTAAAVKASTPQKKKGAKVVAKPIKKTPVKKAAAATTKKSAKKLPTKSVKKAIVKTKSVKTPKLVTPTKVETPVAIKETPAHSMSEKQAHFNKTDLMQFKADLIAMRERITGQSGAMRHAALQRNDESNLEEDGTDAFMRLQTLEQVSSQQQIVSNIDEALRAIEKGYYGVCDICGELIRKQRLTVLPFAKNCIRCQSEMEKRTRRGGRW